MSTTILEAKLDPIELENSIKNFVQARDTGALGTWGPEGIRVSPVKYFTDADFTIYIQSRGGSKFSNIASNSEVCLLVSTPFQEDTYQVEGVQIFGQAEVLDPLSAEFAVATKKCPWPHSGDEKLIKVQIKQVVYVDRVTQEDLKQTWLPYRES